MAKSDDQPQESKMKHNVSCEKLSQQKVVTNKED